MLRRRKRMKNLFSNFSKACVVWILFHGLIISIFLFSLVISPRINFATSLFDILPPSSALHEVQAADSALAAKTGRTFTILVKSPAFEKAKSAAEKLYSHYVDSDGSVNSDFFDSLSLYIDSAAVSEITNWLHKNRYVLLDDETCTLLETGQAQEVANEALASVYGAFTISDLSKINEDPFLLTERNIKKMLENGAISSTAMTLRDSVLARQKDGFWYVLIRGLVSQKGSALANKKNTVKSIYDYTRAFSQATSEDEESVEFIFSGVPFHSYENSTSAQAQISVISTVALVLILFGFLWIFRSPIPAIVSVLAVSFSCAVGFISTLLFFRAIHVLTFVFGTTLIGTCLDYSIHYFVHWKCNAECKSGRSVRNHIFRGITLGFASTEICFIALFFAPFPLLKQVSVFLLTGLASAYLSVVALYPMLKMPKKAAQSHFLRKFVQDEAKTAAITQNRKNILHKKNILPAALLVFSLITIAVSHKSLKIQNNIQELYSMSPQLLQNEIASSQVLDTGSSGWYFILKADSKEELLQKNEELAVFLTSTVTEGKLGSFLALTQFIPSQKTQTRSLRAAQNLLPLAENQFEALGISVDGTELKIIQDNFVQPDDSNLPATIKEAISNLWIGEIDGSFYSCILPLHAEKGEKLFFREYCAQTEGVYFVNKVTDISSQLDILSKSMLKMLGLAFLVVIALLFFCYKPKTVLKIASVPLLVAFVTTAVLSLFKIHLSFFPITALVLTFGLGLDYIIYTVEGEKTHDKGDLNSFAIGLSFITTALSFGALALSTFPPVHMLGLTVFIGLTAAVVSAKK